MALYRAVCNSRNHNPPGIWVYPADGGVDYATADSLATQHMVIDYPGPDGDHDAWVQEYVPPQPNPQPHRPDPCAPEKTARDGAAAALATAWLAMGPACAPSPTAPFTCPLAIAAVVAAYLQLQGNQGQYERCLREHGLHAQADTESGAMAALDAEICGLQALSDQLKAASGSA